MRCKARENIGVRAALAELDRAMAKSRGERRSLVLDNANGTALGGLPLRAYSGNRVIACLDPDNPEPLALE